MADITQRGSQSSSREEKRHRHAFTSLITVSCCVTFVVIELVTFCLLSVPRNLSFLLQKNPNFISRTDPIGAVKNQKAKPFAYRSSKRFNLLGNKLLSVFFKENLINLLKFGAWKICGMVTIH